MPEYASDLDAYLVGLSDLERQLVWLRFVEGRPVAEVASACNLTAKATEGRLARLRKGLRERLDSPEGIGVIGHA